MPPGSTARPPPPAAETVANHGAESSSREYAQPAAGWCRSGSQNPARSSRCDRLAVGHAAVRTAPSPHSDRVAAPTAAPKNRCQASFVCPYKSPQKLSFISARKCWKCSLIGIIFAIGCRSPFQERLSLVRQSQLTPSRLLHNQRYVTQCTGIAVDSAGNAYIAGATTSIDFPTKNAIQPTNAGGIVGPLDAFVTKIAAAGNALIYSTYLGGSGTDYGSSIAVDSAGDAYVVGLTNSFDFPTANAIQPTYAGATDGFVTKFNPTGSALVYSTYLGGTDSDTANGIAVDTFGDAYVTGSTGTNFPTVNAIQPTSHGGGDAFVTEINPLGSAFVYSTYLGGPDNDSGTSIAVDSARSTYIIGSTRSAFPKTPVAFQQTLATFHHGFVAKIAQQTFVSVSAAKLYFGGEVIGTTSPAKTVMVTNTGSNTLTIKKIYVGGLNPGDFAETNTCGSALATGASCRVTITFTPSVKNLRQAGLGISTPDPASPDAVLLNGGGTVVSLSTSKLTFGHLAVGTTSPPQSVTLTNIGSTQLNFTGITITGTNAGDFSETNTCGTSIAAKASCTLTVRFKPTATGTRKASLSVSDDGGASPQRVYLTGTGT